MPYDAQQTRRLVKQGKAMPAAGPGNPGRFPINNGADLKRAIRAVGRVRPDTDQARAAVRRFIIGRAKALGMSSQIPDSWAADGSLKS